MVTQSDIDALNRAIADGVRSVTIRGQTVTYNTTASLIAARDDARRELAAQAENQPVRRTYLYYSGRGY
jgi:hypothetical protein